MGPNLTYSILTVNPGQAAEVHDLQRILRAWCVTAGLDSLPQHQQNPDGTWTFLLPSDVNAGHVNTLTDALCDQYPDCFFFRP